MEHDYTVSINLKKLEVERTMDTPLYFLLKDKVVFLSVIFKQTVVRMHKYSIPSLYHNHLPASVQFARTCVVGCRQYFLKSPLNSMRRNSPAGPVSQ